MADTEQRADTKAKPDYSELPQKPITLKKDIGGLAGPGRKRQQAEGVASAAPPANTVKKKASVKKRREVSTQWTLRGVSKSARELATNTAREEGLKLHEWIEGAIYQAATASPTDRETDQEVLDALQDIRRQLERIEQQSGLLYRMWQRVKAWFD